MAVITVKWQTRYRRKFQKWHNGRSTKQAKIWQYFGEKVNVAVGVKIHEKRFQYCNISEYILEYLTEININTYDEPQKQFPSFLLLWYNYSIRVYESSPPPPKTFWNIFTSVDSFCVKLNKFVGSSYSHISTNFYGFILTFHQMALICPRVPMVFTPSSFE